MRTVASPLRRLALAVSAVLLGVALCAGTVQAAEEASEFADRDWSFEGPFGMFDRGQLQRGYKVYKNVCAACHGMRLLHFRNLGESGGPEFSEEAVKALAASVEVQDGPNDEGEMFTRPAKPSDAFPSPFANDNAARAANNGALPPDLSVIAKAREGGPDYLYALLTGYKEPPADMKMSEGMNYNAAFPGHQIAMLPPLGPDAVEYTDGSPQTVEQYAKDVSAFLMWAAEPKLEERHKVGFRFMIYLLLLAGLLYLAKRRIWSNLKH